MTTSDSTVLRATYGPRAGATGAPLGGRKGTFGRILKGAAGAAVSAIPVVGPAVAAAIPGLGRRGRFPGGVDPTAPSHALEFLELQQAIEREAREFEVASNVLKARHDAAMTAIRNLKS